MGFRGIDTANQRRHYVEAGVGEALAKAYRENLVFREELFLQTKFTYLPGQDHRLPYDPSADLATQVAQSFAASQRNLKTDYVDSLVLHSPLPDDAETLVTWRALESIADSGGARALGISNCYSLDELETLYRAARVKPTIVQNRLYKESGYDVEIRAFCRTHGITYQSFWTLTANPDLLVSAAIRTPASRLQRTPAQVFFRYLTQQGVVPLTGTTSVAHMREDLAIFEFELTADEQAAVTELMQ